MSDFDFFVDQGIVVNDNAAIGGSILMGPTTQSVPSSNIEITSDTVIDSCDITKIQSASYLIQIASESGYEITEIMLVHDNNRSYFSEYGQLGTTGYPLAMFSTEIVNNTMQLMGTAVEGVAKVWIFKTEIETT